MLTDKKQQDKVPLNGVLAEFRQALEDEIMHVKKNNLSSILLKNGRSMIMGNSSDFWYKFDIDYASSIPDDTPCKLILDKTQYDVTVVSSTEHSLVLLSKINIVEPLAAAKLESGSIVLMELLIKCIEDNSTKPNPAGNRILQSNEPAKIIASYTDLHLDSPENNNNTAQNSAIVSALSYDSAFIWGPPGTGKTTVIGQIITELFRHNRSVLVVSHTNTAVDGAIERAAITYNNLSSSASDAYPILRLGRTTQDIPFPVSLEHHISALGNDLFRKKQEIEFEQQEIRACISDIIQVIAKLDWLEHSQLEGLNEYIEFHSTLSENISIKKNELDALIGKSAEEKQKHVHYLALIQRKNSIQSEIDQILNTLAIISKRIDVSQSKLYTLQKELIAHRQLDALLLKQSQYLPLHILEREFQNWSQQESTLSTENQYWTKKHDSILAAINQFESRSFIIQRLSASKITELRQQLHTANTKLEQSSGALGNACKQRKHFEDQIKQVQSLESQRSQISVHHTKEELSNSINQLQLEIVENRQQHSAATKRYLELQKQLDHTKSLLAPYQEKITPFLQLQQQIAHIETDIHNDEQTITELKQSCSELAKAERQYCRKFGYECTSGTVTLLATELTNLKELIAAEVQMLSIDHLSKEKETLSATLIDLDSQIQDIDRRIQQLEREVIQQAKIVGTTLTKAYINEDLRSRTFDTIILDEASMASIPALWCASCLAETSVIIVGDFLQLPPIVMSSSPLAQKWLGQDIFYHSGIQEKSRYDYSGKTPENFVMLDQQYRMEPEIASIANLYYGKYKQLTTGTDSRRENKKAAFYDWLPNNMPKHCIQQINTNSLNAWCTGVPQGKGHSRLNSFSAVIVVELAFKLIENKLASGQKSDSKPSILILAPYKPHVQQIKKLISIGYQTRNLPDDLGYIQAGTVHSFQGSEADIVIFDFVVDNPHWKANMFMTSEEADISMRRMFNVAVTRAKFQLYLVGNFDFLKVRAKNNALSQLLAFLATRNSNTVLDAKELFPNISYTIKRSFSSNADLKNRLVVCTGEDFDNLFMVDLAHFSSRMIIYSPFITANRLSIFLPYFDDAIKAGKSIIVITKALSDRKGDQYQYREYEKVLRNHGVIVLHKKGMHEKLIFIDSDITWNGSLNLLSFSGATGEVMTRVHSSDYANNLQNFYCIESIYSVGLSTVEQHCPICGSEMLLAESDKGGIYYACVRKDYIRQINQPYPTDGILRCRCGAEYIFGFKSQPRWICSSNPKHYQNMRLSDLKLQKMEALIPPEQLEDVYAYFRKRKANTISEQIAGASNDQLSLF